MMMPSSNAIVEKLTKLFSSKAKIPFHVFQKALQVDDYTFGAKIYQWSIDFDLPIEDETIRMDTPIDIKAFVARVQQDIIPPETQPQRELKPNQQLKKMK
jgi:hypothetical protein